MNRYYGIDLSLAPPDPVRQRNLLGQWLLPKNQINRFIYRINSGFVLKARIISVVILRPSG